ncbi:unnamed protein product [Parnassius apollo]|uniref:(apollo) hypothetical protein n=1 Tax=Parnassius apollo TaxID=110799 RepID=A0A8S3WEH0_PARAO|nr:unnamed protein product [Parnassius apollo]
MAPESAYTAGPGAPSTPKEKTPTPKRVESPKGGVEVLVHSPVATTGQTRLQRAKHHYLKAKQAVDSSRNLRRDIKETILGSLDELKKLIIESEADLKAERARKGAGGSVKGVSTTKDADTTFTVPSDSRLSTKLDEHSRLLLESNERMKALQEQLTRCSRSAEDQQRSYACVAAVRPQQPARPAALHSVVVTSKDEEDTGEEVLGKEPNHYSAKLLAKVFYPEDEVNKDTEEQGKVRDESNAIIKDLRYDSINFPKFTEEEIEMNLTQKSSLK